MAAKVLSFTGAWPFCCNCEEDANPANSAAVVFVEGLGVVDESKHTLLGRSPEDLVEIVPPETASRHRLFNSACATKLSTTAVNSNREFIVNIDKTSDRTLVLGVGIDATDGRSLVVNMVQEGLIKRWNESNPEYEVKRGDRFLAVNGIQGDPKLLLQALSSYEMLYIRVRRPDLFSITLRRDGEVGPLGMALSYIEGGTTILVKAVGPGLVQNWNNANKDSRVEPNDRIFEVCGFGGPSQELFERLKQPGILEIKFIKDYTMVATQI